MDKKTRQTKTREPIIGLCQLCHETKRLCYSHIIPNLFFRRTKKPSQAIYLSTDKNGGVRRGQDTWQEYLLCKPCEDQFSSYETYVNKVLYFPKSIGTKIVESPFKFGFSGVDYHKFKLFQLSVLWRASISTQDEFAYINLTHQQNDELRQILLYEKECQPEMYWCEMSTYYDKEGSISKQADFILNPRPIGLEKKKFLFIFGGYV